MQSFELTILGSSSATPTSSRNPTAQLLNIAERYFLIDCGEGAQIQLRRFNIRFQRIDHIFISHLHGDHYFGLMGLLSSMHLLGRVKELHLYCPRELKEIIDIQNKYSGTQPKYPLIYHFLRFDQKELLFEDEKVSVESIVLNHRIPCCGFLFREKPQPLNIIKEKLQQYKIPLEQIPLIKAGKDLVREDGTVVPNAELTLPPPPARSYAYCSDTRYDESVIGQVKGVDLLYHEATFMEEMRERANETFHSTTLDAGNVAKKAGVKKLIIGHFSARYKNVQEMLAETKTVFENTVLANEGEKYTVV